MNPDEEARAAAYRAGQTRRAHAERARRAALAGDPDAARALRQSWKPVADEARERLGAGG